jgi:hypothetical protein
VSKKKRPLRARNLRRALERDQDKLAAARRKLIALEAGGSPARPIEVASAAVIEARAESLPCPDCDGELRCQAHDAREHDGELLRAVTLTCRRCGATLEQYFRIVPARPN